MPSPPNERTKSKSSFFVEIFFSVVISTPCGTNHSSKNSFTGCSNCGEKHMSRDCPTGCFYCGECHHSHECKPTKTKQLSLKSEHENDNHYYRQYKGTWLDILPRELLD